MNLLLELTIPGAPIAKERHRTNGKRTYNPQSEIERGVIWEVKKQLPKPFLPFDIPLIWGIDMYFQRPGSHYGTGKNSAKLKPSAPQYHSIKPDYSNISKFYEDCLNQIVYTDDSLIVGYTNGAKYWLDQHSVGYVKIKLYGINK